MYGVTTAQRIPILAEVADGNRSDMAWNTNVLQSLRTQVGDALPEQVIYVADAAMVTRANLDAT